MHDKAGEIVMLLKKHMNGELSLEEQQRLTDWANESPENRSFYNEMTDETAFTNVVIDYYHVVENSKRKQSAAYKAEVVNMYARKQPRRLYYYIATASVLAILVVGAYFFFDTRQKKPTVTQTKPVVPATNEIPPAGDKAILTLSDGRTVTLADANKGMIAKDGAVVISKNKDGEIVYEHAPSEKAGEALFNSITTPRGGKYKVILPDGSKVWLNAATVLRYPRSFDKEERRVALSGEAYFEVKEEKARPFRVMIVATPGFNQTISEIEVLGTHFNVNAYVEEPQVNTTLLEGEIKFSTRIKNQRTSSKILSPSQRAVLGKETNDLAVRTAEDPATAIAWVHGKFSFENKDMTSLMRELARWYDIQIQYEGSEQTKVLYTGEVDRMISLAELLSTLQQMGTTRFTIKGRTVVVKP
jgi:transmembrane sensor